MPPNPKLGSVVVGRHGRYELVREITQGNMAWSLEARDLDHGNRKVFLKYYKSPTPTVDWYEDYVRYVDEINRRLEQSAAAQYCVLSTDLFTANPRPGLCRSEFFYQTYDFIESGYDLRGLLDRGDISWEKRKTMAKVFLVAMKKVHAAGVVHCDLKPENVQMLPDDSVKVGLIPRMIDMDRSILADVEAPWTRGELKEGYTGTPGYLSPEHLRGEKPTTASDVFTIGIILGELLGNGHPFAEERGDAEAYKAAVLAGRFTPVQLQGPLGESETQAAEFARWIERCLQPTAAARPSCEELHKALLQLDKGNPAPAPEPPTLPPDMPPLPPEAAPEAEKKEPAKPRAVALKLVGDSGELVQRFSMNFGSATLGDLSSQARFAEKEQFCLDYVPETQEWFVQPPVREPKNLTALNGAALTKRTRLADGDVICLLGRKSGKTAMELRVSLIPQA